MSGGSVPKFTKTFSTLRSQDADKFSIEHIFTLFGIKYGFMISEVMFDDNSNSFRDDLWQLHNKYPWMFDLTTKGKAVEKLVKSYLSKAGYDYSNDYYVDRKMITTSIINSLKDKSRAEIC